MRKQHKKQRKKSRFFVKSLVFILIALAVFSYFQYNNTNILIRNFAKENNLSISEWPDELIELLDKNPETKDFVLNDSEEGKRDWREWQARMKDGANSTMSTESKEELKLSDKN